MKLKRKAQLLTLFLATLLLSGMAFASTTYYVDSVAGRDANNGTSTSSPWQTLSNVNSHTFAAGDTILFKRGGQWRGQVVAQGGSSSGGNITYGAYGAGATPLFLGSVDASSTSAWTLLSGNIWQSAQTFAPQSGYTNGLPYNDANDVGNVIFLTAPTASGGTATGTGAETFNASTQKVDPTIAPTAQGQWRFNTTTWRVELYSTSNPGTFYPGIELAVNYAQFYANVKSYIQVEDLEFRYSAEGPLYFQASTNVTVTGCVMSWQGGGNQGGTGVRYGNGIEIIGASSVFVVQQNLIYQTYDGGLVVEDGSTANNITLRNNIVWQAAAALLATGASTTISDLHVYNNTFVGSRSWSQGQRPNGNQFFGISLPHSGTPPTATNLVYENNAYVDAYNCNIIAYSDTQWSGSMTMNYDLWYRDDGNPTKFCATNGSGNENLSTWAASYSAESQGFIDVNPQFTSLSTGDFTPLPGSSLLNAGNNLYSAGVTVDFHGNPRPTSGAFTIGAIQ